MSYKVDCVVLEKGLKTIFMKAYNTQAEAMDHEKLLTNVTSGARSEKYGWLGAIDEMKEWIDERQITSMIDNSYELENVDYENTIGIDRNTFLDDQDGMIKVRIGDLAKKAKVHSRKLMFEQIVANGLCYDGQNFFDSDHAEDVSGAQNNILAGTSAAPYVVATFKADFISARAMMLAFKDSKGNPYNEGVSNFIAVIPPSLQGVAEETFNASMIASTTNTLKGAAQILISSRLPVDEDWYLFEYSGPVGPFIWQIRSAVEFELRGKGTEAFFMRKKIYAGVDARYALGYGLWQKAVKINN